MSDLKYTLISNVSYVDFKDTNIRAWCHGVLIDKESRPGLGAGRIRQIRGLGYYGIPTFTIWIDPDAKVEFQNAKTNLVIIGNGEPVEPGGVVIKAGEVEIFAAADDYRQPLVFEDIDGWTPFGEECDRRFAKHSGGTYYPFVTYGPKELAQKR